MSSEKEQTKARLHPRNKNRERYDLSALTISNPELKSYIRPNPRTKGREETIDFSNPIAIKLLNKALLNHYYGIKNWEFPDQNLCPPIPGRADYIHHIADLLGENNFGRIPIGDNITCLDVGLGASCIYPILGVAEYGWRFIGSDIDPKSIASAQNIVNANSSIQGKVACRLQENSENLFHGIIGKEEKFELTVCNPPFHSSIDEAQKGTRRKTKNLSGEKAEKPERNFAGIGSELIYEGGEFRFIQNMIRESRAFSKNVYWFSILVSKQATLKGVNKELKEVKAYQVKTIPMATGNKSSRIVAWTFLSQEEQKEWIETRWKTFL